MIIHEINPQENFTIEVTTDDGRTGIFDVNPFFKFEAFAELKDQHQFKKILNGKYFIEWDCGADLSADTIEAQWQESTHLTIA